VAITSVFGEPLSATTWSGGAGGLALALRRLGVSAVGISTAPTRSDRLAGLLRHVLDCRGLSLNGEPVRLSPEMRRRAAEQAAAAAARLRAKHVLHLSPLDLPAVDLGDGVSHYLYCDQSWLLSLRHRSDLRPFSARAIWECERLERQSLFGLE